MIKIYEGCYVDQQIPGNPSEIRIFRWSLPHLLCHSPAEEAAARLIAISQQHNQWIGVSWDRLERDMKEDLKLLEKYLENQENNRKEEEDYKRNVAKRRFLTIITLGIYSLFVAKPDPPEKLPELCLPASGIYKFGESYVRTGLKDLLEHGFVRRVSGDNEEVFFLTPKFIAVLSALQERL